VLFVKEIHKRQELKKKSKKMSKMFIEKPRD